TIDILFTIAVSFYNAPKNFDIVFPPTNILVSLYRRGCENGGLLHLHNATPFAIFNRWWAFFAQVPPCTPLLSLFFFLILL
ncbi:MAG: hypothetical protein LUG17_00840, partial [Clostridiales bacterium]|nr:hypothetical protein [Clostridiales bacterium]